MANVKKAKWTDITSRSRGETDSTPRTWETRIGTLRLVVTRHIHHEPDDWVAVSEIFDKRQLTAKNIDDAKKEALELVREWCRAVMRDLGD